MNRRSFVLGVSALGLVGFTGGAFAYRQAVAAAARDAASRVSAALFRDHAPIIGPADAKVTIIEFFDPSCEACRAMYPYVKQIMAAHEGKVRLVLRYAALHPGSDEAVRILEASRKQDKFQAVLDALIEKQPEWAQDGSPNLARAWQIAGEVGLDQAKARADGALPEVDAILKQDAADVQSVELRGTPTFYVNGKPLLELGPQQLYDLVTAEVAAAET